MDPLVNIHKNMLNNFVYPQNIIRGIETNSLEPADSTEQTAAKKRRLRRKKLQAARFSNEALRLNLAQKKENFAINTLAGKTVPKLDTKVSKPNCVEKRNGQENRFSKLDNIKKATMSSKEVPTSREEVVAAREAKKLAKLKAKSKGNTAQNLEKNENVPLEVKQQKNIKNETQKDVTPKKAEKETKSDSLKCRDEVDRAIVETPAVESDKTKEEIVAERAAKKAAKQAKKKSENVVKSNQEITIKDVVETLKDIKNIAKEVQDITAKVSAINFEAKKAPEEGKSKADLKAERRAKQEAQRAAKQAAEQKAAKAKEQVKPKAELSAKSVEAVKEKSPKPKGTIKAAPTANRVNWFQHLHTEHDKKKKIPLNSNLHPAIVKLGVQLKTKVVSGSNARCIALLDALKQMVRDYTLPAKTEFARGLEAHLATSLEFLWSMRQPSASQTNAVKFFRLLLTKLANNVDEFDAKKSLQEEIDKYIEDEIYKAGEAISLAVREKISTGDNILTYGCSSLIERILRETWEAKVHFRTVVVGNRVHDSAREMLRRLVASGLPCTYIDITAISFFMKTINKVVLGAGSVLVNGSVLGAVGTAQVALVARSYNVPVLVACETHKFSERVQTDAFVYNEMGDPDELIDKSDDSPLKDWRSNPNLRLLNLTYDVTPPSLVTAVVTEKAILPCTSAPVVLRTKTFN